MCWKFLISITILVVASLLLVASFDFDRKSFGKTNQQKTTAAKEATKAALGVQMDAGKKATTSQQMNLVLSHHVQQAAKAATEVLAGKRRHLEVLAKRLHENQDVIEEGQRAMELTMCTLKRVLWLRDITRQDLKNMMLLYKSHGIQLDIKQMVTFARHEEAEKNKLLHVALRRLNDLKDSVKLAQAELKSIRESAKKANHAAEEARQRVDLLRKLAPKIKKLRGKDLQIVTDFLIKHRHAHAHSSI